MVKLPIFEGGVGPQLRSVLDLFGHPAILVSRDYRILATNQAYVSHYGTQVREGEDHCYRISHGYDAPCDEAGEACPFKAALLSGQSERVFHVHHHAKGPEHVDLELHPLHDEKGEIVAFIEVIQPVKEAAAHAKAGEFLGRSRAFSEMLELLSRVSPSEVPVLLLGESGTGKELAARTVHDMSDRKGGPFVPLECVGLSDTLFESELFGHVKGAFTGAQSNKGGLVGAARGGTLFLDEIGEIPMHQQVKLLRLLESGTYRPVGSADVKRADFRLVCATHRELPAMVREGTFREDLYFRISAFPVHMPALRERVEDLPLLCESLLARHEKRLGADALDALRAHPFPGNIRELRNILERAVLLCDSDVIGLRHLPLALGGGRPSPSPKKGEGFIDYGEIQPLAHAEKRYLQWALNKHGGDRKSLAKKLGLSERTLYRKLQQAGVTEIKGAST
jgi:DNA-binding NtrC family response regulator